MSTETLPASIAGARARLAEGEATAASLADAGFARIHDAGGEGKRAFVRLFETVARQTARHWDRLRAAGAGLPPLAGVPVSVKDLCDVGGSVTLAGSVALKDNAPAARDATVVARLRAAGATVPGTTNMTEFALGTPGTNPHYGTPLNPYDRATARIPGGSSSGAAVSVADGMVLAALGSDTAGSIRVPAGLCGLVGFKPTARRVPLDGVFPLSSSLDSVGPLARTVACCALVDAVLAGEPVEPFDAAPIRTLRLGLPADGILDGLEPEVAGAVSAAISKLSAAGARIVDLAFPEADEIAALHGSISLPVVEGYAFHRPLLETRGDLYDPIVAARLRAAASVCAADYLDLCRARERLVRSSVRRTVDVDAVLMPTVPMIAPPVAGLLGDEAAWHSTNRRMLRLPLIANFLDRCAISIPCHEEGAAPVGLTLVGATLADRHLLRCAAAVEAVVSPHLSGTAD